MHVRDRAEIVARHAGAPALGRHRYRPVGHGGRPRRRRTGHRRRQTRRLERHAGAGAGQHAPSRPRRGPQACRSGQLGRNGGAASFGSSDDGGPDLPGYRHQAVRPVPDHAHRPLPGRRGAARHALHGRQRRHVRGAHDGRQRADRRAVRRDEQEEVEPVHHQLDARHPRRERQHAQLREDRSVQPATLHRRHRHLREAVQRRHRRPAELAASSRTTPAARRPSPPAARTSASPPRTASTATRSPCATSP